MKLGKDAYVTKDDIKRGLQQLGLKRGDIVIVHSSLSSFGFVEGGAETVIDALLETVGEEGTVIMPTYSTNRRRVRRSRREIELGVTWKYKIMHYDPKRTSCWTGIIPESFRKRHNAFRSLNPTHSIAAIGSRAKEIIEVAKNSADEGYKKVLELDGYVLLIGTGLDVCSAMHLAESRVQLPRNILEKIQPPQELIRKYGEDLGWPRWDIGFGPYPDFAKMEEPCRKHGIMKTARVGKSEIKLLRLKELIDLYAKYLEKNPDIFYHP
ncbi:MAG: AAC(3) family N-acetyltransferase [Candidatus Bathyarchaeia archaeon]